MGPLLQWFARWLRATFDQNPLFPISALLLLAGVRLLARDSTITQGGTFDSSSPGDVALGLLVFQAFELLLLGSALFVLWPRRIAYETCSALRVFALLRFAGPFLVIGVAVEGPGLTRQPGAAAALGLALTALMVLKGEAAVRRIGLDLRPGERLHEYGLFALAAVGFPLLADRLAVSIGTSLDAQGARAVQLGAWWGLALLLAPLACGLSDLGATGPLRSRRPAATWRVVSLVAYPALLWRTLEMAGAPGTPLLALFPLLLIVPAVVAAIGRAAGFPRLLPLEHLPAALGGVVLLADERVLLGEVLSRPAALAAWLPVAALALPLLAPGRTAPGLRSLGLLLAAAPLRLLPGGDAIAWYLLFVGGLLLGAGAWRRREGLVVWGALLGGAAATWLAGSARVEALLAGSALLSAILVLRLPGATVARSLAAMSYALGWGLLLPARDVGLASGLLLVCAGAGLGLLGLRTGARGLVWAAGGSLIGQGGWHLRDEVQPGLILVGLSFAGIPLGTWIAVRRESESESETDAEAEAETGIEASAGAGV